MILTYEIADLIPYINWVYFFHAWGMSEKPEPDRERLRREAEAALRACPPDYHAYALFELFDATSDGDDILVYPPDSDRVGGSQSIRLTFLRQQISGSDYLCLSDFISPHKVQSSRLALFATSVSHGFETDFNADFYQKMMMQLLADRLAEAAAERMHEEVRKHYWGYAEDERLSVADMLAAKYQGIRPAVGYPSLPDASLNFLIDDVLHLSQIGIRLTESGAMKPHASVSGLILAHPKARYFAVGKIGSDQLADYARRRGLPVEVVRRFLAANIL